MIKNYFTSASLRTIGVFLFAICLVASSCKKDDNNTTTVTINYDAANLSAPAFAAGTFRGAAKFPASYLAENVGGNLTAIDFYIRALPTDCKVQVYSKSDASMELVYEANVQGSLSPNSWITHTLASPIAISSEDLWLAVEYTAGNTGVLGCDPGPSAMNGDWYYDASVGTWDPLSDVTNIDINWNIRGKIEIEE